jgi:shikimate dehydrogenase
MTISGRAKLAGILGWPVAHSRSPLLHNHWISTMGMEAAYVAMPVKPANIEAALRALPKLGFQGVNVTLPHKEAALKVCDTVDAAAKRIGAVNTIICKEDGTLEGRNTDAVGFAESMKVQTGTENFHDATVVVLGAGGAARAIVVALVDLGFGCIRISNRSQDRADAMVASFRDEKVRMETVAWDNRDDALDGATMLVNATSLGMKGYDPLEIDLAPLPRGAIVADIIYTPLVTPLMAAARELGLGSAGGLRMLVEQARPAFAAWFGQKPPVTMELMEMLEADVVAKGG